MADFGFSSFFTSDAVTFKYSLGTRGYQAPELLCGDSSHDEKVDVWSTAILAYSLLCKKTPFKKNGKWSEQSVLLKEPDYFHFWGFSEGTIEFLKAGLVKDP